ncbi:MAG TPA: family 78 glycoside hydrolase catalytic domain [Polyangiaceae bacterium]|nr:family 78 glycoside hydrolase catalytic domain [Polyangiaceae bacterium]
MSPNAGGGAGAPAGSHGVEIAGSGGASAGTSQEDGGAGGSTGGTSAAAGGAGGPSSPTAPTRLTVGDRARPMNVEGTPLFGWLPHDGPNEIQTAYEIVVTRASDKAVVWDSNKVASAAQAYVAYGGPALTGQTSYSWTVRTWDREDQASPYADAGEFDTGLSDSEWNASWIRRSSSEADDYTLARRELDVAASPIVRARVYLAANHQAELRLNGVVVDRGPAFAYPGEGYYQATDVTPQVIAGKPLALGVLYHWYGSGQGRPAGERGLLVRLVIQHADGSEQVVVTDSSWRVKRATAWQTGAPKRSGDSGDYVERIDARAATPGWDLPGFDAGAWEAPQVIGKHPAGAFSHLVGQESRVTATVLAPMSVKTLADGTLVADFGQVMSARPVVHFKQGVAGRNVDMLSGYRLLADGRVSTDKLATQGADMSFRYTQAGGDETFRPFTHLAWRYLQIAAPGESLGADAISASLEHTDAPLGQAASFESSDATLNQVFALVQRSALYSGAYQFVDTPTREKGQFLNDASNISFATMSGHGERSLTRQALQQFANSQKRFWPDGRLNAVYPNGDGARDIPDFAEMYGCWAARYFQMTGDSVLLEKLYPALVKVVDYVWSYKNDSTGLITNLAGGSGDYQYGIVDWPTRARDDYDMTTAARTTVNILAVQLARNVAGFATALGKPAADAEKQAKRAEDLALAINAKLRRADGIYIDGLSSGGSPSSHASQHASSYAVAFGIAPPADYAKLATYIAGRGMKQGPMTAHWLLKALGDAEQVDAVVTRLTDASGPGWANVLAKGGTFTWETWEPTASESESHGWGSQALVDFVETLLGVRLSSPGAETLEIVIPRTSLPRAKGTVPTQRGMVTVDWRHVDGGGLDVGVDIPVNVRARVSLPLAAESTHSASGEGAPNLAGVEHERALYDVGSGHSELHVR